MYELYQNIKRYRLLKGWSQEELARRTGYADKSMISRIESGKVDLSQSQILKFAEVFGVSASELNILHKSIILHKSMERNMERNTKNSPTGAMTCRALKGRKKVGR